MLAEWASSTREEEEGEGLMVTPLFGYWCKREGRRGGGGEDGMKQVEERGQV